MSRRRIDSFPDDCRMVTPIPPELQVTGFMLVAIEDATGEAFVIDHGLTADDCRGAMLNARAWDMPYELTPGRMVDSLAREASVSCAAENRD